MSYQSINRSIDQSKPRRKRRRKEGRKEGRKERRNEREKENKINVAVVRSSFVCLWESLCQPGVVCVCFSFSRSPSFLTRAFIHSVRKRLSKFSEKRHDQANRNALRHTGQLRHLLQRSSRPPFFYLPFTNDGKPSRRERERDRTSYPPFLFLLE